MRPFPVLIAFAGAVAMAGCAHHVAMPVASAPPAIQPQYVAPPPPMASATPASPAFCTADSECSANQLCIQGECAAITPQLAECSMFRVHFDFDQAAIHPTDRSSLERMARCLKADRSLDVTIEGNADERGTEEYNLHLGSRRANAVDRYLADLGVSRDQLRTVSYGKDRPICTEHDEACWSQNRRAALKPALVASLTR